MGVSPGVVQIAIFMQTNRDDPASGQPAGRTWRTGGPRISAEPVDKIIQTIFYSSGPIEVTHDQIIEGSVMIFPSEENPRCLNIHLQCSQDYGW
ncbi:uncharacterized protein [Lolium perenne]